MYHFYFLTSVRIIIVKPMQEYFNPQQTYRVNDHFDF